MQAKLSKSPYWRGECLISVIETIRPSLSDLGTQVVRVGGCFEQGLQIEARISEKWGKKNMKRSLFAGIASILFLTVTVMAQEVRNEISVQGTGFFTKDSNGDGISRTTTNTGGVLAGYRFRINRWFSAEGNYGFDRNTQRYFSSSGEARVQSDVHTVTGDLVVNLPLPIKKVSTYALAGGGGLIFSPTGNRDGAVPGADTQAKGAFLYGAGADYPLTQHFTLRAEYRGFVYKNPDFKLGALNTDSWTHTAQPSAGIVYRF